MSIRSGAFHGGSSLKIIVTDEQNMDLVRRLFPMKLRNNVFEKNQYLNDFHMNGKEGLTNLGMLNNDVVKLICYKGLKFFNLTSLDCGKIREEIKTQVEVNSI